MKLSNYIYLGEKMGKLERVLKKYQEVLFLIYPAILILEPKLANNFIIFLLLILVLGNVYLNKKIVFTFYEKFLLIFIGSLIISIIFKNITGEGDIVILKRQLRWLIMPTLLGQLKLEKEDISRILYSAGIGVLGYTCRIIKEILTIKPESVSLRNFLLSSIPYNHRYLSKYNIPQSAIILGITFIILFYLASVQNKNKIYLYCFSVLSLFNMASTQSRGMSLTLFLLIVFLSILRKEKIIRILSGALILISIVIGSYFSNSNYIKRYENIGKDSSSLARVEVYKEALRIFNENKLTGVGYEGFFQAQQTEQYKYNPKYYHPHNMALKMLAETGIIGFICYYIFMGSILVMIWEKYKKNKYYMTGILCVLGLLLYENIEVIFIKTIALPYLFFIIGINLNSIYKKNTNKYKKIN